MATRKDYYSALGVDKSAPQEEIKRAYRKLARKLHPDVNPGDAGAEERFKAVSEAYHVLGDPERRRKYDSVGPEAFAQQFDPSDFAAQFGQFLGGGLGGFRVGGIRGSGAAGARGGVGNLDDLLEGLLGGAGGRGAGPFGDAPPRPAASGPSPGPRTPQGKDGRNVTVRLQLTLEDAVAGVEKTIAYRQPAMCTSCGGAGCSHCKGSGEELHRQTTRVRVPAGVRDGSRVRVKGKGNPASGGRPAGDLNVEIAVGLPLKCRRSIRGQALDALRASFAARGRLQVAAPPTFRSSRQRPAYDTPGHGLRGGPWRPGDCTDAEWNNSNQPSRGHP